MYVSETTSLMLHGALWFMHHSDGYMTTTNLTSLIGSLQLFQLKELCAMQLIHQKLTVWNHLSLQQKPFSLGSQTLIFLIHQYTNLYGVTYLFPTHHRSNKIIWKIFKPKKDHISAIQDTDLTMNISPATSDIVKSIASHVGRMTGHMTFIPNFLWGILLKIGSLWNGTPHGRITLREEHSLRMFANGVLRKIFWLHKDNAMRSWRTLHKEEPDNL
jgi:hypothetical protein